MPLRKEAPNVIDYTAPMYLQLREVLRSRIESGEYPPGVAIPSENDLAETYGINRLTVRSAIDTLAKEGLLKRVQGKGVYVMNNKVNRDLEHLAGFTQTMREKNKKPSFKLRARTIRPAGGKYAAIFGIGPEEDIFCFKRICFADARPIALEDIYIPYKTLPELEKADIAVFSLYELYKFYHIEISRVDQTLDLVTVSAQEAKYLEIEQTQPVMLFRSVSYAPDGRVVEYSQSYTRSDHCDFTVHFR